MLSKTKHGVLYVLGMEIFYVLCIIYGVLLSGKAMELHHGLFELIPGFGWGNPVSMVWGALYMGVLAWIGGWYIAWMHNASIITGEK
jgi:hypothetical protein